MAKILEVDENPLSERRIKRILEDNLIERWPFPDAEILTLDVSIEVAAFGVPKKPKVTSCTKPEKRAIKESEYAEQKNQYVRMWDDKRRERETEIEKFIQHYAGEICRITDDSHIVEFPDSFSARIRMNGKGFTDLIQNYPSLFEVTIPDNIECPAKLDVQTEDAHITYTLLAPSQDSPSICVIDSGIQENHRWLATAIKNELSKCFIPGKAVNDIADYVKGGGHGTRVAGACLYPKAIVKEGSYQAPFWLLNARVLNEDNKLLPEIFPAELLHQILAHYKTLSRVFQHSINSDVCCRLGRMSIWASTIDLISHEEGVLFIQSVGNIQEVVDYFRNGKRYPDYLYEPSSRIANPAQSLQALTVGSISDEFYQGANIRSIAPTKNPSSFSRTGFGMWDSIKPEVVEFGGDHVIDSGNPPSLTTPQAVCPELIRSTRNGGPSFDRDAIGTSFSTPKVSHIAGQLATLLPQHHALLYRALIINSARWPEWAENIPVNQRLQMIRSIGYGVPGLSRATENTDNRITLVTENVYEIKAKEGFIFGIPVPQELRRPGDSYRVRIDVTLSYSGEPRRTRKSRRGYLGVWLDWKASKKNEDFDAFRSRALKDFDNSDDAYDVNFSWTIGNKKENNGETKGVSRCNGTVQKDWTIANSYELPDIFGIVIRGHEGWDRKNFNATSRFTLAVSFEVLGVDVKIYEAIRTAIQLEIDAGRVRIRP